MMTSLHGNLYRMFDNTDVARVASDVGKHGQTSCLTSGGSSVNVNHIRGDTEFHAEIQPHLNSGLWPIYLEECDMRFVPPPTDGREEAPGANPNQTPVVPDPPA